MCSGWIAFELEVFMSSMRNVRETVKMSICQTRILKENHLFVFIFWMFKMFKNTEKQKYLLVVEYLIKSDLP